MSKKHNSLNSAYFDAGACVWMYSSVFCTTPCSAIKSFSFRPLAFFSMPCAMTQKQSRCTCSSCVCSKSYLTNQHINKNQSINQRCKNWINLVQFTPNAQKKLADSDLTLDTYQGHTTSKICPWSRRSPRQWVDDEYSHLKSGKLMLHQLCRIRQLHQLVEQDVTRKLVSALILSRLD